MKRSVTYANSRFVLCHWGRAGTLVCLITCAAALLAMGALGCGRPEEGPYWEFARIGGSLDYDDRDPLGPGYRIRLRGTLFTDRDMRGPYLWLLPAHAIIEIDLSGTKVTDAGLEQLKAFKNLRTLSLNGTMVSDAGMRYMAEVTSLRTLDLTHTHLRGATLNYLASLPELETLHLAGTGVTDDAMQHIHGLRQLRSLRISHTAVSDRGLEPISELTQLQALSVGPMVTDAGIEYIARLKELERLTVYSGEITDAGVERLASLPKLKGVFLQGANITHGTLERLRQANPDLRINWKYGPQYPPRTAAGEDVVEAIERLGGSVKLDTAAPGERAFSVRLTGSAAERALLLPALGQIGRITELHLIGWPLTNADLAYLAPLTDLRRLAFGGIPWVDDAGVALLAELTNLESLDLTAMYISDEGVQAISGLVRLRELSLRRTFVTGESLEALRRMPNLRSLDLTNTAVADADMAHLQALPHLETLGLSGTLVTDKGIAKLEHERLEDLNLRFTEVSDVGIEHIGRMKRLRKVDLDFTLVTEEGVASLRQALPHAEITAQGIGDRAPIELTRIPFFVTDPSPCEGGTNV